MKYHNKHGVLGITGGTGFVGRHLLSHLATSDYHIKVLTHTLHEVPENIEIVQGDLTDKESLIAFLTDTSTLVHLAAQQLPPFSQQIETNVVGTATLVEKLLESSVEQVIALSSVATYGESKTTVKEADHCQPTTPYGLTKYLADEVLSYWQRLTQRNLTLLRPFNVYGPGNTKGVIYSMCSAVLSGKPITIYGTGEQKRDFLYVDDLVIAIESALKVKPNDIINLGSGQQLSLLDILENLRQITRNAINVEYREAEKDKQNHVLVDLSKSQEILHWKASTLFSEGIKKTFSSYKVLQNE